MPRCAVTRLRPCWACALPAHLGARPAALRRLRGGRGGGATAVPALPCRPRSRARQAAQGRLAGVRLLGCVRIRGPGRSSGPGPQVRRPRRAGGRDGGSDRGPHAARAASRCDRAGPGASRAPPAAWSRSRRRVGAGARAPAAIAGLGLPGAARRRATAGRARPQRARARAGRNGGRATRCGCALRGAARRRCRHHGGDAGRVCGCTARSRIEAHRGARVRTNEWALTVPAASDPPVMAAPLDRGRTMD